MRTRPPAPAHTRARTRLGARTHAPARARVHVYRFGKSARSKFSDSLWQPGEFQIFSRHARVWKDAFRQQAQSSVGIFSTKVVDTQLFVDTVHPSEQRTSAIN